MASEVRSIMDEIDLTDPDVEVYIGAANEMVNQTLSGISDNLKKECERFLAAHMIASTRVRMAKKEGAGGAYIEYAGQYGENLSSTSYGQMAMTLDPSGRLMQLSGKMPAKIKAVKT